LPMGIESPGVVWRIVTLRRLDSVSPVQPPPDSLQGFPNRIQRGGSSLCMSPVFFGVCRSPHPAVCTERGIFFPWSLTRGFLGCFWVPYDGKDVPFFLFESGFPWRRAPLWALLRLAVFFFGHCCFLRSGGVSSGCFRPVFLRGWSLSAPLPFIIFS